MARFTDEELAEQLRQGKSQKECADLYGVSESYVSKRKKRMQAGVSKDLSLFSAPRVIDQHVSYMDQLHGLSKQAREILDMIYTILQAEQFSPEYQVVYSKLVRLVGSKGSFGSLLIGMQAELRKQIEYFTNLQKDLYNLKQIKAFQDVVMEEIRKTDPEVAQRIVKRLVEINAVRSSLDMGTGSEDDKERIF